MTNVKTAEQAHAWPYARLNEKARAQLHKPEADKEGPMPQTSAGVGATAPIGSGFTGPPGARTIGDYIQSMLRPSESAGSTRDAVPIRK